jgi:hypothetical protein
MDLLAEIQCYASGVPLLVTSRASWMVICVAWNHSCYRSATGHYHHLGFCRRHNNDKGHKVAMICYAVLLLYTLNAFS